MRIERLAEVHGDDLPAPLRATARNRNAEHKSAWRPPPVTHWAECAAQAPSAGTA
jgi:hypothetical protein